MANHPLLRACFNLLSLDGAARSALERIGVDLDEEVGDDKLGAISSVIGKLIAGGRQGGNFAGLLPGLLANPEERLPLADLSVRASNVLLNSDLVTVGDLSRCTIERLYKLNNCGRKTVVELSELAVKMHLDAILSSGFVSDNSRFQSTFPADQQSIRPARIDHATDALRAVVSSLGVWATDMRSASKVGDLLVVHPGLDGAPPKIQESVRMLMEASIDYLRFDEDEARASTRALIESFDDRNGRLFIEREIPVERPTLEELGLREGLSRERVRQLCAREAERLRSRLALPEHDLLSWRIDDFGETLRNGVPAKHPLVDSALAYACRGLEDTPGLRRLILWAAGPYRSREGWLLKSGCEIPTLPITKELFGESLMISDDQVNKWVVANNFPDQATQDIVERSAVRRFGDRWAPWKNSVLDKAEVILRFLNRPADSIEIVERIGEEYNERAVRGRMFEDDRFIRVSKREWALAEWGLEEYSGIAQEIVERIERDGGSTLLGALVDELVSTFDVSEHSVRRYAEAPMFVVRGEEVRLRRDGEEHLVDSRTEIATGLYPEPTKKLVHLAISVDHEIKRGSGMPLKQPFAAAAGIDPGGRRSFATFDSGSVLVSWPVSSAAGPSLGSIRLLAESVGAEIGDELVVTFDLAHDTARARRIREGDTDVASLTGLTVDAGDDLRALATSLGCSAGSVRTILRRRGESRVLDALPADETSAEFDDAYAKLLDVFAD